MTESRRASAKRGARRQRGAIASIALGGVAVFAACGGNKGSALPGQPTIVDVRMVENRFVHDGQIPPGRVVFRVRNEGSITHRLALLPLPEQSPPIDQQLRGEVRRSVPPYAGVPPLLPGDSERFAVDLAPGRRYAMVCFVRDSDGVTHAVKGMSSEFRVEGAAPTTTTTGAADPPTSPVSPP